MSYAVILICTQNVLWLLPVSCYSELVVSPEDSPKYIVFESQLLELFVVCPHCEAETVPMTKTTGTLLSVQQVCGCVFTRKWNSQPYVNQMPAGNLLLSGAILFSGSQPSKLGSAAHATSEGCLHQSSNFLSPSKSVLSAYRHPELAARAGGSSWATDQTRWWPDLDWRCPLR